MSDTSWELACQWLYLVFLGLFCTLCSYWIYSTPFVICYQRWANHPTILVNFCLCIWLIYYLLSNWTFASQGESCPNVDLNLVCISCRYRLVRHCWKQGTSLNRISNPSPLGSLAFLRGLWKWLLYFLRKIVVSFSDLTTWVFSRWVDASWPQQSLWHSSGRSEVSILGRCTYHSEFSRRQYFPIWLRA